MYIMTKVQVNFRLEESLLEALKNTANTQEIKLTELVTNLLKEGLGLNTQISETTQNINVRFVVKLNHGIQPVHKLTNPTPIMEKKG